MTLNRIRNEDGTLPAYAWPGGYAMYYLDRENSVLCPKCANKSDQDPDEVPQFKPIAFGHLEAIEDEPTFCGQCSTEIK